MGDSLAVELPALTRAALVRIQVPQPLVKKIPGKMALFPGTERTREKKKLKKK